VKKFITNIKGGILMSKTKSKALASCTLAFTMALPCMNISNATAADNDSMLNYRFDSMGKTIVYEMNVNYQGDILSFAGNKDNKNIPSMNTDSISLTMKSLPSMAGMENSDEGLALKIQSADEKWRGNIGLFNADCKADISKTENTISIEKTGTNDKNLMFWFDLGNSDNICSFEGETSDKISLKIQDDNSVLITGQKLNLTGWVGESKDDSSNGFLIDAVESVLIKDSKILIDPDKDGVYTEVQKGDICSDGNIDASDASKILARYAQISSNGISSKNYLNDDIADYNGDGVINASDASAVLAYYAKLSSGQIK